MRNMMKWDDRIARFFPSPKTFSFFALALFVGGSPSVLLAEGVGLSGKVTILDGNHRPLSDASNVVVFLDTVRGNQGFKPAPENPVMASQDMSFIPPVLSILAGSTVSFPNKDDMFHNVFSLSKTKAFDLGLYGPGQEKTVTFEKTGLVKVYCNIHENMKAYILVLGNPYFTLTDKDGNYRLKDVPPGTYTLVCWYHGPEGKEEIVTQDKRITVGAKASPPVGFEFSTGGGGSQHKNKWGMYYDDNY
jgi:plastocyanin